MPEDERVLLQNIDSWLDRLRYYHPPNYWSEYHPHHKDKAHKHHKRLCSSSYTQATPLICELDRGKREKCYSRSRDGSRTKKRILDVA